jgi:hypothetical protein
MVRVLVGVREGHAVNAARGGVTIFTEHLLSENIITACHPTLPPP